MATTPGKRAGARRQRGPRPRHIPQRTCVACREKGDKRGLVRIVRTPEREVEIDPTGKRNGRGAYLCFRLACWERALTTGVLERALNLDVTEETRQRLRSHAATLHNDVPDETAAQT